MARRLARRVKRVQGTHKQAMAAYTPAQGAAPVGTAVTGSAASPEAVSVMPEAQVLVTPEPGGAYSTIAYRGLVPLFTTDGAAIPASSPGGWGQLRMAGRP
jgi:hypothetical protein